MNVINNPNHPICQASRCNTGVALGVAVAAVVAGGATAYAANEASNSAEDAQRRNADNMRDTNAVNYRIFREGRGGGAWTGGGGHALLPLYAQRDHQSFEPELFSDVLGVYDATGALTPEEQLARYQETVDSLNPAAEGAARTVNDLYSGATERAQMEAQAPVSSARLAMGEARKNAALESLAQTVNEIKAINARKGFSGDSYGNRLLEFEARRRGNTEASLATAGAGLENAMDERSLRNAAISMRLNNTGLPSVMRRQAVGDLDLAESGLADRTARRQSLFSPFRIGPGSFRYAPLPMVGPVAGTGQIAGQAGAALASSVGSYYASRPQTTVPLTYNPDTVTGYENQTYRRIVGPNGEISYGL